MRYVLLAWHDEDTGEASTRPERNTLLDAWTPLDDALRSNGHVVAMAGLRHGHAMTIRLRHGRTVVAEGAFGKPNERLAGFYLIEARDLNEAIQVAKHTAAARLGWCIEVRPIAEPPGTTGV